MTPENTPLPAEQRSEANETQSNSASLFHRMKNMATSTRGRLAAAVLALGGAIEAGNKAEAATMRAAEVIPGSQATEIGDDEFAFIIDGAQLRVSNLDDNSNLDAHWVAFRSLDDTKADAARSIPGTPIEPDSIIGPSAWQADGIESPDMILNGQLQVQQDFFLALGLEENGNYLLGVDDYLENGKVYIGMSPFVGDPQNIDEAIAMTTGDVYEADIPDILNQLDLYVIRPVQAAGPSADFNGNGTVDAGDYTVWRDNFGNTNATNALGDADGDSDVDGADFLAWQQQFGTSTGATQSNTGSVPEPSGLALGLSVAAAAAAARRRKGKHERNS
jgi:MYXO-CTERM domain-containing protein